MKNKGEREGYTRLNTEFQRIARASKKAFFNEHSKEIEEDNRRVKSRDLFQKIGNIKGIFHTKMGMIKDRKSKDLIEAEEIEKERIHGRTVQKRS